MTQNIAALTERNIAVYKALNDLDDSRERYIRALSSGPHEACTAYGHYDIEEVDDGGRLIERHERGIGKKFIPVSELPAASTEAAETEETLDLPDVTVQPLDQIEEVRLLMWREDRPMVILRRRTTLQAI